MACWQDVLGRITRQIVPLPIFFRDDFAIDHSGLAKYVAWQVENGSKNLCLTFTYSQLDFVTPAEISDVTRTVLEVVGNAATFVPCTGGGPLHETIKTVQAFETAGSMAAFVHLPEFCLQNPSQCGELYVKYIQDVAKETGVALLAVSLPVYGEAPSRTMLPSSLIEDLCAEDQFIGLKDDIYILEYRSELIQKFAGRIGVIGGGLFSHYLHFHHKPNQSEFTGMFHPQRGLHMYQLLDQNDYRSVLDMLEEDGQHWWSPPDLHWMSFNQVIFYLMGFAETYVMRPPLPTATPEHVEAARKHMRHTPTTFARLKR